MSNHDTHLVFATLWAVCSLLSFVRLLSAKDKQERELRSLILLLNIIICVMNLEQL